MNEHFLNILNFSPQTIKKVIDVIKTTLKDSTGNELQIDMSTIPGEEMHTVRIVLDQFALEGFLSKKGEDSTNAKAKEAALQAGESIFMPFRNIYILEITPEKFAELQFIYDGNGPPKQLVFQGDLIRIHYKDGCFYLNNNSSPFYSMQVDTIPRKLWNFATKQRSTYLSGEQISKALTDKERQNLSTVLKEHRRTFLDKLHKSHPSQNYKEHFISMEGGNLHLAR